jgi:hypothetical protein
MGFVKNEHKIGGYNVSHLDFQFWKPCLYIKTNYLCILYNHGYES